MRVAIISEVFLPKIDGVVNRTLNLVKHLPRFGDELLIVCPRAPGCTECSAPVLEVPSFAFPLYPEYRIGLPDQRLIDGLTRFAPDVIHYVNPFAFGFRCHDVLRDAGLRAPTVFSFHTLYAEFVKQYKSLRPLSALLWWMTRQYHNRADVNLTVSTVMLEDLDRRGFRRVRLWPPAVDTDLFSPCRRNAAMRGRLSGGRPDRPLLLTVSRLAPEKNVAFLSDVLRRVPGACLAIVGDGPQRGDLERQFDGADVQFLGYLRGEELAAAYASVDAFVYASETETMGNVVLEAMACGCPVVAPDAGGIPSLLSHGHSGFLYRPRDPDDAARYARAALDDPALRDRVGQAALREVRGRNWELSVGRVREVYAEAIREAARAEATAERPGRQRLPRATLNGLLVAFRALALAAGTRGEQEARQPPVPAYQPPA